jgi:hypothetical protein
MAMNAPLIASNTTTMRTNTDTETFQPVSTPFNTTIPAVRANSQNQSTHKISRKILNYTTLVKEVADIRKNLRLKEIPLDAAMNLLKQAELRYYSQNNGQ